MSVSAAHAMSKAVTQAQRHRAKRRLTFQLHARFRAGGLAQREPRLDAGALVAAAAQVNHCDIQRAEQKEEEKPVIGSGGKWGRGLPHVKPS